MPKQDSNDIVIQLPWTVPQQPSVQTIVFQQPAKTHMELNASTDKTAISSFALSVVIALALGGLATWLAYWYGRKSFDLTKQSFDVVLEQIISSRQEAERLHKITMEQICANIESNKETSKNQLEIMFKDLHLKRTLNIFESLRNEFSTLDFLHKSFFNQFNCLSFTQSKLYMPASKLNRRFNLLRRFLYTQDKILKHFILPNTCST